MSVVAAIARALGALLLGALLLVRGVVLALVALFQRLTNLLAFLLLVALSLVALAAAVFEIQGDHDTLSLPQLADWFTLPSFRDTVGGYLHSLETSSSVLGVSVAAGIGAMIVGLLLLAGLLVPRRERLATLAEEQSGRTSARRRALRQAATILARRVDGVERVDTRARSRRRGGATVRLRVRRLPGADRGSVREEIQRTVTPPIESSGQGMRARVRVRRRPAPAPKETVL
jgi:hypothetical protein